MVAIGVLAGRASQLTIRPKKETRATVRIVASMFEILPMMWVS